MKTLTTKTLAALLILSIVACTFITAPSAEANCWLAVLACIAAAEDAYDECKDAADNWHQRVKCALALSKAITVCWNAYNECLGSSSESSS